MTNCFPLNLVEKNNRVTAKIELFQEKWVARLFSDKLLVMWFRRGPEEALVSLTLFKSRYFQRVLALDESVFTAIQVNPRKT